MDGARADGPVPVVLEGCRVAEPVGDVRSVARAFVCDLRAGFNDLHVRVPTPAEVRVLSLEAGS